jgi:nucleoside-diphosphate-sugar epimerase
MKKVIVLGSEGFIGNNLVHHFKGKGYEVFGCDLFETSLDNYTYFKVSRLSPEWDEIFGEYIFDYCINAAGSGNVPYSVLHPFTDFEANTLDTIKVLDAIRRYSPACRYLHISSAAVYGNPDRLPVTEDTPLRPLSPYGWHKLMAEHLCTEYHTVYGIATAVARPFSVYGPGLKKQLFWDLFRKYLHHDGTVELWGTGTESRDFIYIADLTECFQRIIELAPMSGETYNVASGEETTISKAVEIFMARQANPPAIRFNGQVRKGDPLNWKADISRLTSLGFTAGTGLETGIGKIVDWMGQLKEATG